MTPIPEKPMRPVETYLEKRSTAPDRAQLAAMAATAMGELQTLAREADALVTYAEAHQAGAEVLADFGQLTEVVQLTNRISQECWAAYGAVRTAREALLHLAEAEERIRPPAEAP